jgi:peptidoglycan/xylan/chitin deacetylase (PgdA/CDA1 family)
MTGTSSPSIAQAVGSLLAKALVRRPVIVLVYHTVSPSPPAHVRHIYPAKSPDDFAADLRYLNKNCSPVSYPQVAAHFEGGPPLPRRAVLVSFDDGYAECFHHVRPLLLAHKTPCTFFLTTDLLDNRTMFYRNTYSLCVDAFQTLPPGEAAAVLKAAEERFGRTFSGGADFLRWLRSLEYTRQDDLDAVCAILRVDVGGVLEERRPYLTTEQAQTLAADGFALGAHGRGHAKLNLLGRRAQGEEILASCQAVQALSGQEQVPFAFPFSGYGVPREFLVGLRAEHPFLGLFFDSHGLRYSRAPVIHRVWTDPPPAPGGPASNLKQLLDAAYRDALSWRWRYLWNVFRARLRARGSDGPGSGKRSPGP